LLGLAVAAGLGVLITDVPALGTVMKLGGSVYLLYLAWQVAGAGALQRTADARPMGLLQATAFQLVNPKVWIFALGAVSTFRPPDAPLVLGSLLVAAIMAAISIPSSAIWAIGGDAVDRLIANDRTRGAVSLLMAGLIAGTVVLVWI
jgi:threonine/homoserine/homoserine lactone efflux protein